LAEGVGDAIAAYLVCRSSICPSDHVFHPFADIPHGSRSPDRIHNTDGQPLAHFYSRGSEAEARRAMMLTKDEARRIAVKVTRLPEPLGKAAGDREMPRRPVRCGHDWKDGNWVTAQSTDALA
jgi:hypothetical protein